MAAHGALMPLSRILHSLKPQPDIDVLIPAFNAGRTIEASVRSICNQTMRNIRIIVVDDGSSDDTPEILRRLAMADDRILLITTPNQGIVDALNTALGAARAELVARFDADDLAFPNRLAVQCDYLARNPHCVGVGCNVHFIDEGDARTGQGSNFAFHVPRDPFHAPASEPYLLHPFLLARRKAMETAGGYRYVFHSEDADLYWRLSDLGTLNNLPDVLGEYRLHTGSVSGTSPLNGRIQAVSSQLAALSERRRRSHQPDLTFPRGALDDYKHARTLSQILHVASLPLTEPEAAYLAIATAAKLLELSSYRPYKLEAEDFQTMRNIIRQHHGLLARHNRLRLLFRQIVLPDGLRSSTELKALMPVGLYPAALIELAAHAVVKMGRALKNRRNRLFKS